MPWHVNRPRSTIGKQDVYAVTTINEASRLWYLSRTAIVYAIDAGLITARKSGKTWLISVASMIARYGKPKRHLSEIQN